MKATGRSEEDGLVRDKGFDHGCQRFGVPEVGIVRLAGDYR